MSHWTAPWQLVWPILPIVWLFWALSPHWRTRLIGLLGALSAVPGLLLFLINASAGCYPWSPSTVEFHQGMTICPGQTARGAIMLPWPEPFNPTPAPQKDL